MKLLTAGALAVALVVSTGTLSQADCDDDDDCCYRVRRARACAPACPPACAPVSYSACAPAATCCPAPVSHCVTPCGYSSAPCGPGTYAPAGGAPAGGAVEEAPEPPPEPAGESDAA